MAVVKEFKKTRSPQIHRTTLASVESLTMPLIQEVVISADFQCVECQKRIADMISRMSAEMESVEVNVLEKKVTLTCRYPTPHVYKNPFRKVAAIKEIFRSSWRVMTTLVYNERQTLKVRVEISSC